MRRRLAAALVLASCASPAPRTTPPPADRPPVVVAIVVDQLASWIADERLPLLPATGGFARLRREGTWHHQMRFAHASTDTGPGHAALYTGLPPRDNGVWGNERVDDEGVKRSIFLDPATKVVGPGDSGGGIGSSAIPLRKQTIADRLRAARPDAVIVSVSLKDRSAILGAGRRPTVALWFDRELDTFVTSSAYSSTFPLWAAPIAGHEALVARRKTPWRPLDPRWLERNARVPDDGDNEGDLDGFGKTFPHDFAATKQQARALRASPIADEVTLELAQAAIERLARPDAPLFVAISLSGNDYIQHLFGSASRESWDGLLRVDAGLARLFTALDARYGADGWSAVLASDHGAERPLAHRLIHRELTEQLNDVAAAEFGPGPWVSGIADPYVFFSAAARALPPDRFLALLDLVRAELCSTPGIADAVDARETPPSCPPEEDESVAALVCRTLPPTRDPRVYVVVDEDGGFDSDFVVGTGDSHGSPREEDRTVPFFVRAPGRVAAGRSIEQPVSYRLFSDTLAALLRL